MAGSQIGMEIKLQALRKVAYDDLENLAKMDGARVLVGIPDTGGGARDASGITNAVIGYLNEYGSPAQNIPARSWLVAGINQAMPEVVPLLRAAVIQRSRGNKLGSLQTLMMAGMKAVNVIKLRMQAGLEPALQPATIAARLSRLLSYRRMATRTERQQQNKSGRMQAWVDYGNAKPLLDTGEFRNAIGYRIEGMNKP